MMHTSTAIQFIMANKNFLDRTFGENNWIVGGSIALAFNDIHVRRPIADIDIITFTKLYGDYNNKFISKYMINNSCMSGRFIGADGNIVSTFNIRMPTADGELIEEAGTHYVNFDVMHNTTASDEKHWHLVNGIRVQTSATVLAYKLQTLALSELGGHYDRRSKHLRDIQNIKYYLQFESSADARHLYAELSSGDDPLLIAKRLLA